MFLYTPWRRTGEANVRLHSFLTSTLGVSGQPHVSAALPPTPRKGTPASLEKEDGLRSRSGRFGAQKNLLLLAGFESRIVLPTSSRINASELQK